MTETELLRSKYKFVAEGFATQSTEGVVPYGRITYVKRDKHNDEYTVHYLNDKGSQETTVVQAMEEDLNTIDELFRQNIPGVQESQRRPTLLEAAGFWGWLFFAVAFIFGVAIYLSTSGDSLRIPIIIYPIIWLALKFETGTLMTIIAVTGVICAAGTAFSYKKGTVLVFENPNAK